MLLIGDIHITSKQQEAILAGLRDFVKRYPDEQNIIFLGDYVYHFTYDRKALLALFGFFVELYQQGKNVRVLAGNHDWIDEHFVFAEGKWSFDLLNESQTGGIIRFITQPEIATIEGQDILFFPFRYYTNESEVTEAYSNLLDEQHPGMTQSARANSSLQLLVDQWRNQNSSSKLTIIHHRYIVDTAFPGQQARFSYKSPGLSAHRLDVDDVQMISGHLHQPFVYKNYCCVGSVWSTSPLEVNQIKYLFHRNGNDLIAHPVVINPYISLEMQETGLASTDLQAHRSYVQEQSTSHLQQGSRHVTVRQSEDVLPLALTSLYLRSATVGYNELPEFVSEDLLHQLRDYKIKSTSKSFDAMMEQLQDSSMQLDERIADWKTLLQRFLQARYGSEYDSYYKLLQELKIL